MSDEESYLMIVHQYPTPKIQDFLSPSRKKTHEVLPRISEPKLKKQNIIHIHGSVREHAIPYSMRPCCIYKNQEQYRPHTDVKKFKKDKLNRILRKAKLEVRDKNNCPCHGNDNIALKNVLAREKLFSQKYLTNKMHLPSLKQFNYKQICDSESKHKVVRTEGSMNLSDPNLYSFKKFGRNQSYQRKNSVAKKEKDNISFKSSYIRTFDNLEKDNSQDIQHEKQNQNQLLSPLEENKYQQYLEKDSFRRNNVPIKRLNQSLGQTYSFSSKVKLQTKQLNTVFHSYKKQQSSNVQIRKRLKIYSAMSNGLFKIPQEDELEEYFLNYTPINPQFDVKSLVNDNNFQVVLNQGKVYFGEMQNGKKHGRGINISEKEIYEGIYQHNIKLQGCEKNKDGIFIGHFQKGKRHAKGKFVWKNGQQFEGEWKQGKKNGLGKWKSPKGDYYQGQWKQNKQNGKGFYYHRGVSKYKGFFKDFLKHGQGEEEFFNGDKYIGEYQNGKPHGYGRYIWSNGDVYQGEFIQGSRQGKGKLKQSSGDQYEGQFKNDMKHGAGKQFFSSGQTFSGEFKQGKKQHGKLSTKQGSQIQVSLTQ